GAPTRQVAQLCEGVDPAGGEIVHTSFCRSQIAPPATATAIMWLPGSAPPLPTRKDEFQRAVGHGAGRGGPVNEREGLRGSLGGDGCRQHRVAGGGVRAAAREPGGEERAGGGTVGPGPAEGAPACGGSPPGP